MFQWLFYDTFWFVYEQISHFYCQTFPRFIIFYLNVFLRSFVNFKLTGVNIDVIEV